MLVTEVTVKGPMLVLGGFNEVVFGECSEVSEMGDASK